MKETPRDLDPDDRTYSRPEDALVLFGERRNSAVKELLVGFGVSYNRITSDTVVHNEDLGDSKSEMRDITADQSVTLVLNADADPDSYYLKHVSPRSSGHADINAGDDGAHP
jgi:hypothetical protein